MKVIVPVPASELLRRKKGEGCDAPTTNLGDGVRKLCTTSVIWREVRWDCARLKVRHLYHIDVVGDQSDMVAARNNWLAFYFHTRRGIVWKIPPAAGNNAIGWGEKRHVPYVIVIVFATGVFTGPLVSVPTLDV
ncbi:MAG: hypothetical protein ACJAVV_003470 [Alphaproteobacteria bacterium]|jgi:hypothetical protein